MSLFKNKKKNTPSLYYSLNACLEEAYEQNKKSFYFPLLEGEEDIARAWATSKHLIMSVSHSNGFTLVYKFDGV